MDAHRFDELTKAAGTSRRRALKLLGAGMGAGLLALGRRDGYARHESTHYGCRPAGQPCEGNQECCPGLECRVTGPGGPVRCALPV